MKNNNKITHLTPELMEGYLNGTLDDATMHQVERLMLDSDFEAEAMEGLSQLGADERHQDLEILHKRLEEKTRKRAGFRWWQLAAAVALLAVAVYFVIPDTTQSPVLSETEAPTQDEVSQDNRIAENDNQAGVDTSNLLALNEPGPEETKEVNSPVPHTGQRKSSEAMRETIDTDDLEFEEIIADSEIPESPVQAKSRATLALPDTTAPPQQVVILEKAETENTMVGKIAGEPLPLMDQDGRTIRGRIIMQDGTPLPGVNVAINGTNEGTISDIDGYYQIQVPNDASLVFSLMGMERQEITRPSNEEINITMEQDAATLSEVVVTGSVNPERTAGAAPITGQDAFEAYLEKNLRYPDSELEGTVIIRLDIGIDGSITDKKIIRSMGEAFDKEAIRLIDEGPLWSPALKNGNPVNDRVRVKINFSRKN